jgi:hypothetical protein
MITLQCAIHHQPMSATVTTNNVSHDQTMQLLCVVCATTQDSLSSLADNVTAIKVALDKQATDAAAGGVK